MFALALLFRIVLAAILVLGGVFASSQDCLGQALPPPLAPLHDAASAAPPGTPRQQEWRKATIQERIELAEQLGEEGARKYAARQNWKTLMDGRHKSIPQGLDQVYRGPDGKIFVVEAKGGSSPLGKAYGHFQGTSEWAVEAAKRTLDSRSASVAEKKAAEAVLRAAAEGKLEIRVVRTRHSWGEPVGTFVKPYKTNKEAAKAAESYLATRSKSPAIENLEHANHTAQAARGGLEGGRSVPKSLEKPSSGIPSQAMNRTVNASEKTARSLLRTAGKWISVVGPALEAGLRANEVVNTEQQYQSGQITIQQRELAHARTAAEMAGGWAGACAGARLGAMGGGAVGTCITPGAGTAVGSIVGGLAGGLTGYFGGEAAASAAAEWTVKKIHATGTTISSACQTAYNWLKIW